MLESLIPDGTERVDDFPRVMLKFKVAFEA